MKKYYYIGEFEQLKEFGFEIRTRFMDKNENWDCYSRKCFNNGKPEYNEYDYQNTINIYTDKHWKSRYLFYLTPPNENKSCKKHIQDLIKANLVEERDE